jgi:hypothetical protein
MHATTILAVRHRDRTCLAGDGQVTLGATVLKHGAKKIRRLYNDSVLAGFAGSAADSFALYCASRPSWNSTGGTSSGRRWSWPATGAPTALCAGSRR